jgi:hypothetical protein
MQCYYIGAWIKMEKGIRQLIAEETSKGLGALLKEAMRTILTTSLLVRSMTSFSLAGSTSCHHY